MRAIGIIPARYDSSRLPGKPLADLCGLPLVIRVWQNAIKASLLSDVYIACDNELIAQACIKYKAKFIMTDPNLPSGTDRIYAAYCSLNETADIVVNIQGDEPLLLGSDIDNLVGTLQNSDAGTATFYSNINCSEDIINPNCVKLVQDINGNCLYFSRSPIPYPRDIKPENWSDLGIFKKHIGIYAYKINTLRLFTSLAPSDLENIEKLEQLRLLSTGEKITASELKTQLIGVDTPEDLAKAKSYIEKMILNGNNAE